MQGSVMEILDRTKKSKKYKEAAPAILALKKRLLHLAEEPFVKYKIFL